MKYKEFSDWCNQRACDGCWSMDTAIYCIDLCSYINSFSPWKREKLWKKDYETFVVTNIVDVINEKIKKFYDKYLTND